jgi:hypothetical protein
MRKMLSDQLIRDDALPDLEPAIRPSEVQTTNHTLPEQQLVETREEVEKDDMVTEDAIREED